MIVATLVSNRKNTIKTVASGNGLGSVTTVDRVVIRVTQVTPMRGRDGGGLELSTQPGNQAQLDQQGKIFVPAFAWASTQW